MSAPHWTDSDALYADVRNFFKVEQWTADDLHVDRMLYADNRLDKVEPAARYLIRQRSRVVDKWPK
jgi:hypothetical protein